MSKPATSPLATIDGDEPRREALGRPRHRHHPVQPRRRRRRHRARSPPASSRGRSSAPFPSSTARSPSRVSGDDVTVQRDVLGIPTITADDTHDLFYAQGYVHAQDRFWEMDFRRHVTAGRVSELFGESQLATDKFLRTLGWREIAEQEVEALDPTVRAYYDAYAEGVNAYLSENHGRRRILRIRGPRAAEPRLRDRAVDPGGLRGMAEGHGVGPPLQHRDRDRARDRRRGFHARRAGRALPGLPVRPQSRDRADHLERPPSSARSATPRSPARADPPPTPRSSGRRSTASSRP